jgi:hypothetical protein
MDQQIEDLRFERDRRVAAAQLAALGVEQMIGKAELQPVSPPRLTRADLLANPGKIQGVSKAKIGSSAKPLAGNRGMLRIASGWTRFSKIGNWLRHRRLQSPQWS